MGRARQSSAFGGGAWTARGISDPRPIRDKAHQKECVKELILFLSERQYDLSLSPKMLTRPSSKEVANILQFLFRQIDPRFKVKTARPEEDIAKMFGVLRYPFKVTRSALQAAGSQHTWPTLLGAIVWVIELLKYDELASTGVTDLDSDSAGADKMFFDYLSQAYAAFLSADDDRYEELEVTLKENFAERNKEIEAQLAQHDEDLRRDVAELEEIGQRMPLEQKERKAKDCNSDLKKFEDYNVKIQQAREKLDYQIVESETKHANKLAELEQCKERTAELGEKIRTQDLNMADLERMAKEKARMCDAMEQAAAEKEQMRQQLLAKQSELVAKLEQLEQFAGGYNDSIAELELHPPSAQHANGLDFSIGMERDAQDHVFSVDLVKVIKPALMNAKSRASQRLMAARETEMELEDKVEESTDAVKAARDEASKLEARVKQAEASCRREKDTAKATLDRISAESDRVEDEIVQIREDDREEKAAELAGQQQVLAQLKDELAAQREAQAQLKEQINAEIMQALTALTDHKAHVQQQLQGACAYVQEKESYQDQGAARERKLVNMDDIGPSAPPLPSAGGGEDKPKKSSKKSRRDRRAELRDVGFKRGSGVDYSNVASRHMDDTRFERAFRQKEREVQGGAAAAGATVAAAASDSAAPAGARSSTMEALMRMQAGLGEQTIAQKLADPNRPTWDQYKKDNEEALNINGSEIQDMIKYRKELDEERERALSRGVNHKDDKHRHKKHKKHKKEKKKHKKEKKKHKKKRRHSSDSDAGSESDSADDSRRKKRRRKEKKKKKKKGSKDGDSDSDSDGDAYRLSNFWNQGSSSASDSDSSDT
eukprot:g2709.t1